MEWTRKERMDNPLYHQFLDLPLLNHARAYNYMLAAVLLSEGLEVKLKLLTLYFTLWGISLQMPWVCVRAEWLQSLSSRKTDSRCIKMMINFNYTILDDYNQRIRLYELLRVSAFT